ncbi:MAG: class I SAM-dependent methyltransferase [Proteobacteria bacterium]|nr:class I SAM-dependent methyltransferase [Pseudomonadota bacterium]
MSGAAFDPQTLGWYDDQAQAYATRPRNVAYRELGDFLDLLPPGGAVLELGCGGGQDAEEMIRRGYDVTPTDGSPGLAAQAQARLGRPVRVMRFDELEAVAAYDGVWANACLLHVEIAELPAILARVWRALKPGGVFMASYKAGVGGDRDSHGRYFNFPTAEALAGAYAASADWVTLLSGSRMGGSYDQVPQEWLMACVRRPL